MPIGRRRGAAESWHKPNWSEHVSPDYRLRCSFCRRSTDKVERLVSGASAYICDACIAERVTVLERHGGFAGARPVH